MLDIACIILTKDEELHIERCIHSVQRVCQDVWVIDSFSSDDTCTLAKQMGAHVVQHTFTTQAAQFNWAIDNLPITNRWLWRVDADEIIEDGLAQIALRELEQLPEEVTGIYVNKKIIFMDKPLKHGGWYPAPQIKIIRRGHGRSEDKVMDEHLIVQDGNTTYWDGDQTDWNLRSREWWWQKHVGYAQREALNMIQMNQESVMDLGDSHVKNEEEVQAKFFGNSAERKRWMKHIYAKCPLYVRPIVYFVSRYFLMGGILDGYRGWYWHTHQGLLYRMLVDRNLAEIRRQAAQQNS